MSTDLFIHRPVMTTLLMAGLLIFGSWRTGSSR
jgi:hypothetical protein